jgi:hypothetical protein
LPSMSRYGLAAFAVSATLVFLDYSVALLLWPKRFAYTFALGVAQLSSVDVFDYVGSLTVLVTVALLGCVLLSLALSRSNSKHLSRLSWLINSHK